MLIGVLSDSHGRVETTRRAVGLLLGRGVDLLLHLGDIGSEGVIDELVGYPARIVLGNCDDERALGRYAALMGVKPDHPAGRLEIDGKTIIFTHGHLPGVLDDAVREGADYVLHGHTHEVRDQRIGRTRVVNPGALFRADRYTAAVLDPATDGLEIIQVPR